jgi:predicted DsbA family dithiol-disulfide isomerase
VGESFLRPAPENARAHAVSGAITVYSDIGCPWASLALAGLRRQLEKLPADLRLVVEHRAFPLELFNRRGTSKHVLDAEIAVIASTEPDLGWSPWRRADSEYPGTALPAFEAVQAVRHGQAAAAADLLDAALRRAFYVDCRTISLFTTITDVAAETPGVDADLVFRELSRGSHRRTVHDHFDLARSEVVQGSPHQFLPDGRHAHNPAVRLTWTAEHGRGFPVIHDYWPEVWAELVEAARTAS